MPSLIKRLRSNFTSSATTTVPIKARYYTKISIINPNRIVKPMQSLTPAAIPACLAPERSRMTPFVSHYPSTTARALMPRQVFLLAGSVGGGCAPLVVCHVPRFGALLQHGHRRRCWAPGPRRLQPRARIPTARKLLGPSVRSLLLATQHLHANFSNRMQTHDIMS